MGVFGSTETKSTKVHGQIQAMNLVWFERHPNIVLAIQREKSIKRYRRAWKTELIEGLNPTWLDLYERIDEIDNAYHPHPNARMWSDYN